MSEFIHEVGNVVFLPIISSKFFLVQRSKFPIIVGHGDAFEFAGLNTLATIGAFVNVIAGDIALGGTVEDDDLKRIGGTIFGAQVAARAFCWFKVQASAKTRRGLRFFKGIFFCNGRAKKRSDNILEHGSESHDSHPFNKTITKI